jgi:hypothetical protein
MVTYFDQNAITGNRTVTPDLDSHIIVCRARDGSFYAAETRWGLTFDEAVEAIRSEVALDPDRVIWLNPHPSEGWSRDVSEDIAHEIANRTSPARMDFLPDAVFAFVEYHAPEHARQLREEGVEFV